MAWQLARYSGVKLHYSLCDDEGAAPVARRAMHALNVHGWIRSERQSSRACRRAWIAHRSGGSLPLALCTSFRPGAVAPESDREPYENARVEIHAYLGLRRLLAGLLVSYMPLAHFYAVDERRAKRVELVPLDTCGLL